jgi:hypothetical protein
LSTTTTIINMIRKKALLYVLLSFHSVAMAIHTPIPTPLLHHQPNDLSLTDWAYSLNKHLSETLCQENSHWRNCYDLEAKLCLQIMYTLSQGCTTKMQPFLPQKLNAPTATLAGRQVGFCVGELFYQLAQDKLKPQAACQKKPS